jgi:para-nitrobenzyl esterase
MRMPAVRLAEAQAQGGGKAFSYLFSWDSPTEGLGSTHGIDLGYTFGTFDDVPGHDQYGGTGADAAAFSEVVQDLWLSFARDGAPAPSDAWPAYDTDRRATLLLGLPPVVADDPDRAEREAWS